MLQMLTNTLERWAAFPKLSDLLGSDPQNLEIEDLSNLIARVTDWGVALAGSVALIYLIYGGIVYMTSAGDTGRTEQGKKTITWALVGLVVVISAYALVKYFAAIFIVNPGF